MQESRPPTRMLKDDPPDCLQASDIGRNGHMPDDPPDQRQASNAGHNGHTPVGLRVAQT
ncbi:10851_t:CDS:2 [Paraglomus brasilianum]|uniref:10851_t:CDS:1 n=1 Tax=Paraglomus brasilianum TaxID=144538 RepID=A0A9N9GDR8_9GLOM|nr:10851_t:CDS:2 [Paraglomus brasilianum]